MAVRRTGQFFLLGALILASLMAGIVLFEKGGGLFSPSIQPTKDLFDRTLDEFPHTVNLAVAENASGETVQRRLYSFLAFQDQRFDSYALQHQTHAVVVVPAGGGVDVIVANFRGVAMENVVVDVAGQRQEIAELPDQGTRLHTFTGVGDQFTVSFQADADTRIDEQFTASTTRVSGLYTVIIAGDRQRWRDAATY